MLTDYQASYGNLLIGDGTNYDITQVGGLLDLPDLRTSDQDRLRGNGQYAGDDFLEGRTIDLTLDVITTSANTKTATLTALATAFQATGVETPFVFQFPGIGDGGNCQLNCRVRKRTAPMDINYYHGVTSMVVELYATDPVIYDGTLTSLSTTLPINLTAGGMTFPMTFNLTFGAASYFGTMHATNYGNFPVAPTITINGPVVNPTIQNLLTGEYITLNYTVASGETLTLNFSNHTILSGSTASRYYTFVPGSTWFSIYPGSQDITFRSTTSTHTSESINLSFRNGWV